MTYNGRSKTMSLRIDPQALDVLEWDARLRGVKLRTELRDQLEAKAELLSEQYQLNPQAPDPDAITIADLRAPDPADSDPPEPKPLIDVLANYDPDSEYVPGPPEDVTHLAPTAPPDPPPGEPHP